MHTSFYRATQAMFDTEEPTTPSDFGCVVVGTGSGWMMLHCAERENESLEALSAVRVAGSWPELYDNATDSERGTVFLKLVRRVVEDEPVEMTVPLGDTTEGDEMLEIDADTGEVIWRASHQYWGA